MKKIHLNMLQATAGMPRATERRRHRWVDGRPQQRLISFEKIKTKLKQNPVIYKLHKFCLPFVQMAAVKQSAHHHAPNLALLTLS
jgi:hypothetical protein